MSSLANALQSETILTSARVLIVAGKGGVGKTTVGASAAVAAARAGCDVLLIELEGHSSLGAAFGTGDLAYDPTEVQGDTATRLGIGPGAGRLRLAQLRPDEALSQYLADAGLGPLVKRLSRTGAVDVVATAAPGIRDLITLGKIRQMEEGGVADLIVVDAPASGHARTFLTTPAAMAASTDGGPVREQADKALAMMADSARCQVMLVTLAEETPVTETIETAYELEERVDVALGPIVVNAVWPPIDGLEASLKRAQAKGDLDEMVADMALFRLRREADQQAERERLAAELPLPQVALPYLFTPDPGLDGLSRLATVLADGLATIALGDGDADV